uniref:Cation efflux protein transmembrane domain-containing protein n=1 Tax=Physcomitrium patens TaxID=3218 RepID=A0A7I4BMV3_PHYPA
MFTEKERIETEMALRGASETTIPAGLAFVSLPLTPPGNPPSAMHHRDFGYDEAASSVSAAGLLSSSSSVDPSYPLPLLSTASHSESGLPAYGSDPSALAMESPRFQFISEKQQSRILSPHPTLLRKPSFLSRSLALVTPRDAASPHPFSRMYGGVNSTGGGLGTPNVKREEAVYGEDGKSLWKNSDNSNYQDVGFRGLLARIMKPGNKPLKKVFVLIILNLAYSATEFVIGLLTGRVGLVSDAFHLSFGCGVLTFSLFAMTMSDRPPDKAYTFGHERLEVLAALTNAVPWWQGGSG